MQDITVKLSILSNINVSWQHNNFYDVLDKLKENYEVSYWEGEEDWAGIINDDNLVGYVWCKLPLVLSLTSDINSIKESLSDYIFVEYIQVGSLTEKCLTISPDIAQKFFFNYFDYNLFSAEDLWFYNNSR